MLCGHSSLIHRHDWDRMPNEVNRGNFLLRTNFSCGLALMNHCHSGIFCSHVSYFSVAELTFVLCRRIFALPELGVTVGPFGPAPCHKNARVSIWTLCAIPRQIIIRHLAICDWMRGLNLSLWAEKSLWEWIQSFEDKIKSLLPISMRISTLSIRGKRRPWLITWTSLQGMAMAMRRTSTHGNSLVFDLWIILLNFTGVPYAADPWGTSHSRRTRYSISDTSTIYVL